MKERANENYVMFKQKERKLCEEALKKNEVTQLPMIKDKKDKEDDISCSLSYLTLKRRELMH